MGLFKYILVIGLFFITIFGKSQTTLSAGDIAIVGFAYDNPDEITLVTFTSIAATTELKITDNCWKSSGAYRSGEGTDTWTASKSYAAGDTIMLELSGPTLAATGDQILIYQGSSSSPIFIFALNSESTGW